MTSPRVEKQKQVVRTNTQAVKPKTASSTTAPLLSFKSTQNNTGLSIEHTTKPNQEYVQSYVKVKSKDGKTYNFNATLEKRINNVTAKLQKAEKENGFIGKTWSRFKNLTGIGDSSDKVREQQAQEKKLLAQFNSNPQNRAKIFEQLTGQKYTNENLEKFIKGKIKLKSEIALQGYKEGQEMAIDVGADIVSGIAAVGIYSAAVAAAPFTGGASIAVGVAAAGVSGAAIKTGLKAADAATGGRKYTLKDAKHDAATGAFSGVIAPITGGMGGAVGKTVATKLGIQAVKTVGKEVAEEVVETGVKQGLKQGIKTALTNPTGYEYLGGNIAKRGVAMAAEMASDGAVGGAVDNAFRTTLDGGSISDVAQAAGEGFVGGAIMSPIIGGGFKAVGKAGHKLGSKVKGENDVVADAVETSLTKTTDDVVPVLKTQGATTKHNISDLLTQNGYIEKDGVLVPTREFKANRYSQSLSKENAAQVQKRLKEPLTKEHQEFMQKIMNSCDGKYAQYWNEHPEELILFAGTLKKSSNFGLEDITSNANVMENMIASIQNKPFGATLKAFEEYQNAYSINFFLRDLANGTITPENMHNNPLHGKGADSFMKLTSKMQSHLEKSRTSSQMTLHRGDSPHVFETAVLPDGTKVNFFKDMDAILNSYDAEKANQLLNSGLSYEEIQKLAHTALRDNSNWKQELTELIEKMSKQDITIEMPGFMSASASQKKGMHFTKGSENCPQEFRGVYWNLDVPKNSKATCIDVIDPYNQQPEYEFLFQKNSKLKIKNMKLEETDGHYYIKIDAEVVQNTVTTPKPI